MSNLVTMEQIPPPLIGNTGIAKHRIVVLGAGPSGLAAAWSLVQDGHHVTLLEKEPVCGGMAATFARGKFRYDLGPHNFHSPHRPLVNFLQSKIGEDLRPNPVSAEIYFRKKRIRYPFEGIDILGALNIFTALACAWSFLWCRASSLFINAFKDDGTYRTWLINRFGKHFFDIFFDPYTEKVWGVSTREMSDMVARKRIPVQSLFALIHSAIFRKHQYHPEHIKTIRSFYPRFGSGQITDFFNTEFLKYGGEIIYNAQIHHVTRDGDAISGVEYSVADSPPVVINMDASQYAGFVLLSTIPLTQLVHYLAWDLPEEVRLAAGQLDFSAEILLYLDLSVTDPLGVSWLYFSEPDFPFNRIYDVGRFSSDMAPPGQTALCLEITCSTQDQVWEMTDQEIFEMCIVPLEQSGLLSRQQVLDFHTRRLTHAYPRFRVGYQQRLITLTDYLETSVSNLWTFGRQGLFSYINVDEALWMGLQVATNIFMKKKISLTSRDLFPNVFSF